MVVILQPETQVPATVDKLMVGGAEGAAFMKASWAATAIFLDHLFDEGASKSKGPIIFAKATNVVELLRNESISVSFAFYRMKLGGLFQIFVQADSTSLRSRIGSPYISERSFNLDSKENVDLIMGLISQDEIEVCFVAPGNNWPCTGYFSRRAYLPNSIRENLNKEIDDLISYNLGLPIKNYQEALAQYNSENPMEDTPVLLPKSESKEVMKMLKDVIVVIDTTTANWIKSKNFSKQEVIGFALETCSMIADDVWPDIQSWMNSSGFVPSIFGMPSIWDKSKIPNVVRDVRGDIYSEMAVRTGSTAFGGKVAVVLCMTPPKSEIRKFTDKTEEQAISEIMSSGITRECIREVKMTRHEENKVVEGEGKNNDEAVIKAKSKLRLCAVDINGPKFIRQAEQGTIEIQAEAEWQARKQWDSQKEKDAKLDVFQCITTPRGGIFGIGRRMGLWKISWSKPVIVQFSYRIPSEVTITFTKT